MKNFMLMILAVASIAAIPLTSNAQDYHNRRPQYEHNDRERNIVVPIVEDVIIAEIYHSQYRNRTRYDHDEDYEYHVRRHYYERFPETVRVHRHQYWDNHQYRWYFYDPVTRHYYWEDGEFYY